MDFEKKLGEYTEIVNKELERALDKYAPNDLKTAQAMRYSLMAGGKRIRPILSLATADALTDEENDALIFGCSIEMIHTYSLIHDDLPCLDNDTLRRGVATCHVKFGEAYALLAGDGLLTLAFEYCLSEAKNKAAAAEFALVLARAAGINGMVGGQNDDVAAENEAVGLDFLRHIHRRKTGALIDAACSGGAVAAGKAADYCREYSEAVGLAFQIADDILDVCGDTQKMGKTLNKDEAEGKSTFVSLLGIENAKKELRCETDKAISFCRRIDDEFLEKLAEYLLVRQN